LKVRFQTIIKIDLIGNNIGAEAQALIDELLEKNKKIFSDTSEML